MKKRVKKIKTKNVKVNNQKVLKSHEILTDKLKRKKVILYLYKGIPVASRELVETDISSKKLRLIRLKVGFMNFQNNLSIDMLTIKDHIELLDIDLRYLELFFKRFFDNWTVSKIMISLIEKHDATLPGKFLQTITLDYNIFIKLVKFLELMLKEASTGKCNL